MYIKKFNESNNQFDLISFEEIENYFIDLIDEDVVMELENLSDPFVKIDGNTFNSSPIHKKGYNLYQRKLIFRFSFKEIGIKEIKIHNKFMNIFANSIERFIKGRRIQITDLNSFFGDKYSEGFYLSFYFLENIHGLSKEIEDEISDAFDYIEKLVGQKSISKNVEWNSRQAQLSLTKDQIKINCNVTGFANLTNSQINKLIEYIKDKRYRKELNAKSNAIKHNNGQQISIFRENQQSDFEYFTFDINRVNTDIIISNIKKMNTLGEN